MCLFAALASINQALQDGLNLCSPTDFQHYSRRYMYLGIQWEHLRPSAFSKSQASPFVDEIFATNRARVAVLYTDPTALEVIGAQILGYNKDVEVVVGIKMSAETTTFELHQLLLDNDIMSFDYLLAPLEPCNLQEAPAKRSRRVALDTNGYYTMNRTLDAILPLHVLSDLFQRLLLLFYDENYASQRQKEFFQEKMAQSSRILILSPATDTAMKYLPNAVQICHLTPNSLPLSDENCGFAAPAGTSTYRLEGTAYASQSLIFALQSINQIDFQFDSLQVKEILKYAGQLKKIQHLNATIQYAGGIGPGFASARDVKAVMFNEQKRSTRLLIKQYNQALSKNVKTGQIFAITSFKIDRIYLTLRTIDDSFEPEVSNIFQTTAEADAIVNKTLCLIQHFHGYSQHFFLGVAKSQVLQDNSLIGENLNGNYSIQIGDGGCNPQQIIQQQQPLFFQLTLFGREQAAYEIISNLANLSVRSDFYFRTDSPYIYFGCISKRDGAFKYAQVEAADGVIDFKIPYSGQCSLFFCDFYGMWYNYITFSAHCGKSQQFQVYDQVFYVQAAAQLVLAVAFLATCIFLSK